MSNWELYAQVAFQRPETRFGTVYQALRNPHLKISLSEQETRMIERLRGRPALRSALKRSLI
jgi:hypothetical protein